MFIFLILTKSSLVSFISDRKHVLH